MNFCDIICSSEARDLRILTGQILYVNCIGRSEKWRIEYISYENVFDLYANISFIWNTAKIFRIISKVRLIRLLFKVEIHKIRSTCRFPSARFTLVLFWYWYSLVFFFTKSHVWYTKIVLFLHLRQADFYMHILVTTSIH